MTEKPAMLNEKKKRRPLYIALSVVLGIVALAIVLLFAFDIYLYSVCYVVEVSGTSMRETLSDGDRIYALKTFEAQRGDVVIIDVSACPAEYGFSGNFIIKRLIALEGDEVKLDNGSVLVKYAGTDAFVTLQEDYVTAQTLPFPGTETREWTVGEGEIFFLGDNRTVSLDARKVGCLSEEQIVGVVPQWAIAIKGWSTAWETFRGTIAIKN